MSELNPVFLEGLAQLETQGGKKAIKGTNNLYNIKDFSGGGVKAKDKAEGSNDAYRVYDSPEASTKDLVDLLSRKYPKALQAKTGAEFAVALKDGGYATDPNYVQKLTDVINSRVGSSAVSSPVTVNKIVDRPLTQSPGVTPTWDMEMPAHESKRKRLKEPVDKTDIGITGFPATTPVASGILEATKVEQEAAQKEQGLRDGTGVLDVARATFMHQLGPGPILKYFNRPDYEPEAGFEIPAKAYDNRTSTEQQFISEAVSQKHLERIQAEIGIKRDDDEVMSRRGIGVNILAGAIAGAPTDFATGMVGMKMFNLAKIGASQLAAQGRVGAAVVSGAAEAGVTAAAVDLTSAAFDKSSSTKEIAMDVAGSMLLGGALNVPGAFHGASRAAAEAMATRMADEGAARTLALREQAVKNLGELATPEQLAAEIRRLETNEIRGQVADTTGAVPASRRLMPEDDATRIDTPETTAAAPEPVATASDMLELAKDFKWVDKMFVQTRVMAGEMEQAAKLIEEMSGGRFKNRQELVDYTERGKVTVTTKASTDEVQFKFVKSVADQLQARFLPNSRILLTDTLDSGNRSKGDGVRGTHSAYGGGTHIIAVVPQKGNSTSMARTLVHEMGHAITAENAQYIPPALMKRVIDRYDVFKADLAAARPEATRERWSQTSELGPDFVPAKTEYNKSLDEIFAEKFVSFVEKDVMGGNTINLPKGFVENFKAWIERIMDLFNFSKEKGWLNKDEPIHEFYQQVLDGTLKRNFAKELEEMKQVDLGKVTPVSASKSVANPDAAAAFASDPVARKHGLSLLPLETPLQQAEANAIRSMYAKASENGYSVSAKRLSWLMDTAVFKGAQSVANRMLRSANPVVRMAAAELLESPSGAAGRRSTAAIAAHMNERAYLGNALNDYQASYAKFRTAQGETAVGDFFGGKTKNQFDRLVAEEIESRHPGASPVQSNPAVKEAADHLQQAYERIRQAQTTAKTIGWASLPESSVGYMPHRMNPEKVRNLTVTQQEALHQALMDQFVGIEGFDISFSNKLARQYIDSVKTRALGGFSSPLGVHQVGAADVVEQALQQMGLNQQQVTAMMKRYMAGGPGHTKRRLKLDLNQVYGEGPESFKLLDLFTTDQFSLLRSQAKRVAGEVALARHGVMGKPGLKLLRRAMEMGGDGERATVDEIEAFDQVAAEFMNEPFGTQNKMVDRVMQLNSIARLGGMGFTQFAEAINGIFHVGALRTMNGIAAMPRLRSEIKALASGKKVENPIIGSLEQYGGAEFGTDAYKTVFPFDNESLAHQTYGQETLAVGDRLLRGGAFTQGRLSFWRSIHSAQQRGFAEQIVRKAAMYLKDGGNDVALRDMGISDELMAKLRNDLPNIAKFEGNNLTDFDITKTLDKDSATEFTQAIHRGVSQIIQGTFIGETSKWSHDGMMRLMTQFRTFSLTSVEKQWGRQVGNVGTAKALGMMMGSMSIAAPIYMARTYLASVGRADQDAYLERQLTAERIARATLNYIAMSGLAGELIDATSAVTGISAPTGGRAGAASNFVGNIVAPAAGLVDDVWKGLQDTKEGMDPHDLIKTLPFSRLPFLIPAINALD